MTPDQLTAPRVYPGVEYGEIEVPLDQLFEGGQATVFPEAQKRGLFAVRLGKNGLIFTAGRYVGLIPINDRVVIDVRPKLPVRNLTRLLAVSGAAPLSLERLSRDYSASDESVPLLLDLFTQALLGAMDEVRHHGLLREYQNRHEDTSFPRGRVLHGATMQRHAARGVTHRVVASVFRRATDNGPNRLLRYALWHLAQFYAWSPGDGAAETRGRLGEAYSALDGVALDHTREFLAHPAVVSPGTLPAVRSYYRVAVDLAKALLTSRGVSLEAPGDSTVSLPTLLLNLGDVFEAYVRAVIQNGFSLDADLVIADGRRRGSGGARKLLFDGEPSEDAAPDVVVHAAGFRPEAPLAVIEIKYKEEPARDDLNQLIAYSASYRCGLNVLVHPAAKGSLAGLHKYGIIGNKAYYSYSIDLGDADLLGQERALVQAVRDLLT